MEPRRSRPCGSWGSTMRSPRRSCGAPTSCRPQFVETGNAELGIVAFSQLANRDGGSRWVIPEHLHAAIAQDAVLLKNGAGNAAAVAFVDFLKGPEARKVKARFGYGAGD